MLNARFEVEVRDGVPDFFVAWEEGADAGSVGEFLFHLMDGTFLTEILEAAREYAEGEGRPDDFSDVRDRIRAEIEQRVAEEEAEQGVESDPEDPDAPLICPTEAIGRLVRRGVGG